MGRNREPFTLALAGGERLTAAARAAGIGLTTAKRWQHDPAVRASVAAVRGRMVDEAVGRLAALAGKACDTLEGSLAADEGSVKLRAALGILDRLIALRDASELEGRIAALEEALSAAAAVEARANVEPFPTRSA